MALTGNTNEEKIWNYLYSRLSNPYGVAGIMGNMFAESGLRPENLQNTFEKKLSLTDAEYTAKVDNGSYTRDQFINDKAGYGLVQWTYWSLKQGLYDYIKNNKKGSIGDLENQLEFLCHQLSTSYTPLWNAFKTATSVLQASNDMLLKFERPADQSVAVQEKRAGYGQVYYDKFAKSTTTPVVENKTKELKIGDIVNFTGVTHYISATAATGKPCTPGVAKVTAIYPKGTHPYHLIAEKGTVYGWVNAVDIAEVAPQPVVTQPNTGGNPMSVLIGHAAIDERGKSTGGIAGDQNGNEVCTRTWYNKPWTAVFRPMSSAVAETIAKTMEAACANNNVGYDRGQRLTLFQEAKKVKFDISKITTPCECDCSSLVAVCVIAAGVSIPESMYTGNEESVLTQSGRFNLLKDAKYISESSNLKRGDILFTKGHTAVVLSNGTNVVTTTPQPAQPNPAAPSSSKVIGTAKAQTTMTVRTGAGTQYQVLGYIPKFTSVEVLEQISNGWYKIVWTKTPCGYAYVSNAGNKYFVYTPAANVAQPTEQKSVFTNYLVKVTTGLNIRKGPGKDYPIVGIIKNKGTYTIVEENGKWGRLKSGAGWISLDYTVRR